MLDMPPLLRYADADTRLPIFSRMPAYFDALFFTLIFMVRHATPADMPPCRQYAFAAVTFRSLICPYTPPLFVAALRCRRHIAASAIILLMSLHTLMLIRLHADVIDVFSVCRFDCLRLFSLSFLLRHDCCCRHMALD